MRKRGHEEAGHAEVWGMRKRGDEGGRRHNNGGTSKGGGWQRSSGAKAEEEQASRIQRNSARTRQDRCGTRPGRAAIYQSERGEQGASGALGPSERWPSERWGQASGGQGSVEASAMAQRPALGGRRLLWCEVHTATIPAAAAAEGARCTPRQSLLLQLLRGRGPLPEMPAAAAAEGARSTPEKSLLLQLLRGRGPTTR
eukprot:202787-Chlamydomonas_euryale.AAC.2